VKFEAKNDLLKVSV